MIENVLYAVKDVLGEAVNTSEVFLLYTAAVFLLVVLLGALVSYRVCCTINERTRMNGLMRVEVTLNAWPDDGHVSQGTRLSCGEYLIGMQDPKKIAKYRVDPELSWLEKASFRRYSVGALLSRFASAYRSAGFGEEASCRLLAKLAKDDVFCGSLGVVYRKSAKEGLNVFTGADMKKDGKDKDRLCLYLDLSEDLRGEFQKSTGCFVENICITLDYCAPDSGK